MKEAYRMPVSSCVYCNKKLDGVTSMSSVSSALPLEGSFSICISCGGFLLFGEDLKLEKFPFSLWKSAVFGGNINKEALIYASKDLKRRFLKKHGYVVFDVDAYLRGEYEG